MSSRSRRLKSAATWGRTRKAAEHQTRSGHVQTPPNSRLHLQGARWRTRRLSLVAARRAVGNILPLKEQRDGRGHLLSKLNVLCGQPHAPPPMASSPLRLGKEGSWSPPSDLPVNMENHVSAFLAEALAERLRHSHDEDIAVSVVFAVHLTEAA